jgi:hypothetical protein
MQGEETGPLDLRPLLTSASSSVTAKEGSTYNRHTAVDIVLVLPWLLWSRLVVWPMIISEFQQQIKGAIEYEKEFYKNKDMIQAKDPWTFQDMYDIFCGRQDGENGEASDPKFNRILRSLPDSRGSEQFYKKLKMEVDPQISQATCQTIGMIISNYIDDIEKMNQLRTLLITYYH